MPNDEAEPRSEQARALGGGDCLDQCSEREREEAEEAREAHSGLHQAP